tara:strand:- start:1386 stop:1538 length:153 start_codon:yes stop_codon:yes gene_type:complete
MTALGVLVFIAITGMFFSAALLIIKGGRAESHQGFKPSLHALSGKQMKRA